MTALLTLSYVAHVLAAAFWTGTALYVAAAVLPATNAGDFGRLAFGTTIHRYLLVTRWTGLVLPVTGLYQIWVLYPLDALLGTTRGHLVLGMSLLWGVMNTAVEAGIYRMQTADGTSLAVGRYTGDGFDVGRVDAGLDRLLAAGRPYLLAAAGLAVVLLADAALLAAGTV